MPAAPMWRAVKSGDVTETMTSSPEGFCHYIEELEGTYVEIADEKLLPVVGSGKLDIVAEQPG